MTDDLIKLAKRAVACKGWRWMQGMSNDQGQTIDGVDLILGKAYCGEWDADMTALPDLTDPATLGCLLALVRVAYADPYASVWYSSDHNHSGDRWSYYSKAFSFTGYATEAEALVGALEAAL
tara:strand:+ start:385 stop:750 length:366 start_codon:yes stop_codon:yes gene_type:complete